MGSRSVSRVVFDWFRFGFRESVILYDILITALNPGDQKSEKTPPRKAFFVGETVVWENVLIAFSVFGKGSPPPVPEHRSRHRLATIIISDIPTTLAATGFAPHKDLSIPQKAVSLTQCLTRPIHQIDFIAQMPISAQTRREKIEKRLLDGKSAIECRRKHFSLP
jgi:hypothetical protein